MQLRTTVSFAILTIFLAAGIPTTGHAQLLKKVTDKAKEAVEQRQRQAERKVDQTIDRTIDEALDRGTSAASAQERTASPPGMPSLFGKIQTEANYSFSASINYYITIERKGRPTRTIDYELLYQPGEPYSAMRVIEYSNKKSAEGTTVIYDTKNQCMVILAEGTDNKGSMAMPWEFDPGSLQDYVATEKANNKPPVPNHTALAGFESIGFRNIAGFKCQGYRIRDETSSVELWMCGEFAPELQRILQQSKGSTMLNTFMPSVMPSGMLIEIRSDNKTTAEITTMTMTKVDTKRNISWQMKDYPRSM